MLPHIIAVWCSMWYPASRDPPLPHFVPRALFCVQRSELPSCVKLISREIAAPFRKRPRRSPEKGHVPERSGRGSISKISKGFQYWRISLNLTSSYSTLYRKLHVLPKSFHYLYLQHQHHHRSWTQIWMYHMLLPMFRNQVKRWVFMRKPFELAGLFLHAWSGNGRFRVKEHDSAVYWKTWH